MESSSVNDNDRIPGSGYKNQHIIGLKMEKKGATLKDIFLNLLSLYIIYL